MASVERMSSFRHEGHIFFIYDHKKKTEEDDPKDAILYFYPSFVEIDDQIALVGGIIGLADFCLEFLPRCIPSIVKLSGRNFALLQHEDFIIGLGGSTDIPDAFLTSHMQFVWSTFVLYQGSLSALRKRVSDKNFARELKNVWDYYLPLRQIQEDAVSQAFQVLPYVQLHKSQGNLFLHASHILQRSLTHKGVLAGALFNKNKVLCTQLSNSLTRQLLLLMSHSQFPCVEANSVLELPGSVRLLHVYLPKNECVGLGYRRKKAYTYPKTQANRKERSLSGQSNRKAEVPLSSPDYISAQNFFSDDVGSAREMLISSRLHLQNGDEVNDNQRLSREAASTSAVSPTGGVTSGTDSEVFLDTLSDVTFDIQNQLKLTDIKQVECATSGREVPHQDTASNEAQNCVLAPTDQNPSSTLAQKCVLASTETLAEQEIATSEHPKNITNLEVDKPIIDVLLKVDTSSENHLACSDKLNEISCKSSNDVNKQTNSASEIIFFCNEVTETALHFKNDSNQNENTMELENTAYNFATDIITTEFSDLKGSEVSTKIVLGAADSDIQNGNVTQDYLDSSMTSTDSSHLENSSSLEQQQNKEYPKLKSESEISDSSPACQDINVALEPDSEIRNSILICQNDKVASDFTFKDSVSDYQNGKEATSNVCTRHSSKPNEIDNVKTRETSTTVENDFSDLRSLSASDLANDDSGFHNALTSSDLSKENTFNVTKILAQNKEQIDASLEAQLSGDESSTQSSSETKQDDHKASTFSLANSEISATKDRLIFESIDSEYSEGGLLSPEIHRLSPVTESSGHLVDDMMSPISGSEDGAPDIVGSNNLRAQTKTNGNSKKASYQRSRDVDTEVSEWDPQKDDLQEMILYAQGHSDTLLLLLVSRIAKCNKSYISSLWKSCLSHLAELDFQVKDAERHAKDDTETIGAHYQYMKYDSFTQNLKGSALLPVTSLANEIVDTSIRMHESFMCMPELQEVTYRSHSACCYGQRTVNSETYFQLGLSKMSAGICPPNDKTFCLDQIAEKNLQNDK